MPKNIYDSLEGPYKFTEQLCNDLAGYKGVYIISISSKPYLIQYPRGRHNIIYIGQSKDIGARLKQHRVWNSVNKNWGLYNYIEEFTLNVYIKKLNHWKQESKKYENDMILDFENEYGCAPICNLQTGNPNY